MSLSGSTVPEVVGVTVPPGDFRTPRAVVDVRCGAIVVRVTVRRLSATGFNVVAPMAADGAAGVEMPATLWEAVEGAALAAVRADGPAAVALMQRRQKRHAARISRGENDGEA